MECFLFGRPFRWTTHAVGDFVVDTASWVMLSGCRLGYTGFVLSASLLLFRDAYCCYFLLLHFVSSYAEWAQPPAPSGFVVLPNFCLACTMLTATFLCSRFCRQYCFFVDQCFCLLIVWWFSWFTKVISWLARCLYSGKHKFGSTLMFSFTLCRICVAPCCSVCLRFSLFQRSTICVMMFN